MSEQHPITPPPEMVWQWLEDSLEDDEFGIHCHIATQAARWGADWGADIELNACCEWIANNSLHHAESDLLNDLRAARRPKPKSRKQRALDALAQMEDIPTELATEIRQALEELPDD